MATATGRSQDAGGRAAAELVHHDAGDYACARRPSVGPRERPRPIAELDIVAAPPRDGCTAKVNRWS